MRNIPFLLVTIFFLGIFLWEAWLYLYHPTLLWHQLLSHPARSILSAFLCVGGIGIGVYFLKVRHDDRVLLERKLHLFVISILLLAVNLLICGGTSSPTGLLSIVMVNIFVFFATPLFNKMQEEIKQGMRPGPTAKQLKTRFWFLIALILGGFVIANLFMWPVFAHDFLFAVTINALVLVVQSRREVVLGAKLCQNRKNYGTSITRVRPHDGGGASGDPI